MTNDGRKQLLEIYFVLPFGVEATIYPWGITTIKEYIDKSEEQFCTQIVDFMRDHYFTKIVVKHRRVLKKIFNLLKRRQISCFFNLAINPYNFVGAIACCGRDFFKKINIITYLSTTELEEVDFIKSEVEEHILKKIRASINLKHSAPRVWAFSVYDGTLFNTLYITSLIKEVDPNSTIILGGDYFDFDSAQKLICESLLIDAVIVGYGEETLRKICKGISQGVPVNGQQINGLVNRKYLQGVDEGILCKEVEVPPFYYTLNHHPVLTYVRQSDSETIHILTQRGCSWGRCSFCTQIDRCSLFTISTDELLRQIFEIVRSEKLSKISLIFDSEEVSSEFLIALLKGIQKKTDINIVFYIRIWFQVKSFRKELIHELLKINPAKVDIMFGLNFESLNYETLIHMKKGHTPFMAIEAAKAIIDCGQSFNTNYFTEFPLETVSSIINEINILEKVVHLLKHERGDIFLFPYAANKRDDIFNNQEKYGVKISRNPEDKLLNKVFGVDLPCSYWAYEYKYKFHCSINFLFTYIYNQINKCLFWQVTFPNIEKQFGGNDELKNHARLISKLHKIQFVTLKKILKILSFLGDGQIYQRRLDVYSYLRSKVNSDSEKQICTFVISGNLLIKNYNFSKVEEQWTLHLDNVEKEILYFLYWRRKMDDVIEKFEGVWKKQDILSFISYHIKLGTIIRYNELLLCVANNPEYWNC